VLLPSWNKVDSVSPETGTPTRRPPWLASINFCQLSSSYMNQSTNVIKLLSSRSYSDHWGRILW
jgi:hypothetical protein